jgi:hypothetical protein
VVQFEVFNRDAAAEAVDGGMAPPLVRVCPPGRLLFNHAARVFLTQQCEPGARRLEVALLFDAQSRTVGVRPLAEHEQVPAGARWPVVAYRSIDWPVGLSAPEFVACYRLAGGQYAVSLLRGPGPRMVTFVAPVAGAAGRARRGLFVAQ